MAMIGQACFASSPTEVESARRFVQGFYSWYAPKSLAPTHGPAFELALKSTRFHFSPQLARALREDYIASTKVKDEIVGLDFDPFLNSQDPPSRYTVGKGVRNGTSLMVNVHSVSSGKPSATPDVVAKLQKINGNWCFTNFVYPGGDNLLDILARLRKDRTKGH